MAKTLFNLLYFTFLFLCTPLFFSVTTFASAKSDGFSNILSPAKLGLKREKLSHLHFYFHDIVSGPNPTAVQVASAAMTNQSKTDFGEVVMVDDPLTAAPDRNSKLVGKAQGIYAAAAQDEVGLLMVMNFAFMEGEYNGSTLSLLGRNTVYSTVREMPIVGGSGLFRFARGYAQAKTHTFDVKSGDAVVEYDVYVFHYSYKKSVDKAAYKISRIKPI
ncbi:hypothetical protein PTKIN_Ptkin13bG0229800 [Pterospermum kingtungense]